MLLANGGKQEDTFARAGRGLKHPREDVQAGRFPRRQFLPELNQFLGANNVAAPDWHKYGLGWCRHDFSWAAIEPENDLFAWGQYDRIVEEVHRQGFEILPMLGYTAPWAATNQGDGFSPPKKVPDWEDFVAHAVARYSRPPFNLRYFQVWNEPTVKTGFWHGKSDDEFFEKVHMPAAKIIRRYGCFVVFGGWPCSDSLDHLAELLDKHKAWQWTDILDLHYFENSAWQTLYDRYIKTGKCRGLWQTEIGFHPFPGYLPNCYLRALHFGLRNGWSFPDQYKLFWFAFWGAGEDGPKCLTTTAADGTQASTEHGKRLLVMNEVLGKGTISVFSDLAVEPRLAPMLAEEGPTALGFRVGDRRVVIVLLLDAAAHEQHPEVELDMRLSRKPQRALMVTSIGRRSDLPMSWESGRLKLTVPMSGVSLEVARSWGREWKVAAAYVVVE